ncbi:MAG: hypothetical protein HYU54_05710 [Actinobacteria bacterium]|nr:hypothetical protein [Actinomycetota bacterium]
MRVTLRRRPHVGDERGATLVIVALALMAIFGMVVLVVDVGGALVVRQQMIRSADSASLAAAQSFGIREALCGVDESLARQQADTYAVYNASGTTVIRFATDCGASEVTVDVESALRRYIFAPILGGPSQRTIHATATAIWGPAGGGNAVPIVLNLATFQGDCDIPLEDDEIGQECYLWYDNDRFSGSAFGFLNLNQWGVNPSERCDSTGGANLRDEYIQDGYPTPLVLNYPDPTYVCVMGGLSSNNWDTLEGEEGEIKLFPINDPDTQIMGSNGNQIDKFNIIGYAALQIDYLLTAQEAGGASGDCSTRMDLAKGQKVYLASIGGGQCPGGAHGPTLDVLSGLTLTPSGQNTYDATEQSITWTGDNTDRVRIQFHWEEFGRCGTPPGNASARCLITSWQGYKIGGIIPGGGEDFGLRAVRLLE